MCEHGNGGEVKTRLSIGDLGSYGDCGSFTLHPEIQVKLCDF